MTPGLATLNRQLKCKAGINTGQSRTAAKKDKNTEIQPNIRTVNQCFS